MEEYKFVEKETMSIKIDGIHSNNVFQKTKAKFGLQESKKIKNAAIEMYKKSRNIFNDPNIVNNNLLIVGKVQSGKTANLEMFTALCFDNGVKLVIIYGGYDNTLLQQTANRFKETFDINDQSIHKSEIPELFTSMSEDGLVGLDERMIYRMGKMNKPIIIVSLKRASRENKVGLVLINEFLEHLSFKSDEVIIIDDEGDQASLNTEETSEPIYLKDGSKQVSATHEQIIKMKDKFSNPLYLSVTASPHANIFLDDLNRLQPDDLILLYPGDSYSGGPEFHFENNKIIMVEDDIGEVLDEGLPESLRISIYYYLISSAILKQRAHYYTDMIIHSYREKDYQENIYQIVTTHIKFMLDVIEFSNHIGKNNRTALFEDIKEIYSKEYFNNEILNEFQFDDLIDDIIDVVKDTYVVLKNSSSVGKDTQLHNNRKPYKIIIGGDLLQRGVTFENLVVSYYTRNAKGSNMDTTLQRARWFGYRSNYFDLCKVFMSPETAFIYSNLVESDEELWEQLEDIVTGNKALDEIVIDATNLPLKPTRGNVVYYDNIKLMTKWRRQKTGISLNEIIENNNKVVERLFHSKTIKYTNAGRRDNGYSGRYIELSKKDLYFLIDNTALVFEEILPKDARDHFFNSIGSKQIYLVELNYDGQIRERSFNDQQEIFALQQGRSAINPNEANYLGDTSVIVDKHSINIQTFKIKANGKGFNKIKPQYMYAIYSPETRTGFIRGEK